MWRRSRLLHRGLLGPGLLAGVDLVAERERHALALGADPDVAGDGRLRLLQVLLQRDVGERVLAEDGLRVQVGRHEAALARHGLLGRQALHIGRLEKRGQVLVQVGQRGVDGHLKGKEGEGELTDVVVLCEVNRHSRVSVDLKINYRLFTGWLNELHADKGGMK